MNIIFCDMGSYIYRDVYEEMVSQGHSVNTLYYHFKDKYVDEFFTERLTNEINSSAWDVVFSINFFPVIATVCAECGIPYVSWSYDSPLEENFLQYFSLETSVVFLFDRAECEKINKKGYNNVFHLPLSVNVDRLKRHKIATRDFADISFVGSLYKSYLDALMMFADDYSKGYIEGLFQTQFDLFGVNIIESAITDDILGHINGNSTRKINKTGLCYAINRAITHSERVFLLNELSADYKVNYYGYDKDMLDDSVNKFGPVKYFSAMNDVFLNSTLNLCPTLRSITSGIPLRALDITGCGATLFSNYQPELAEYYADGESAIIYYSIEDAFAKAEELL